MSMHATMAAHQTGWSIPMSIKTTFAAAALVALTAAAAIATAPTQAQARGPGVGLGIAAGVIGATVVGSTIAANDGYYGYGFRHCGWTRQYDIYGNYVRRVRSCNY
jgi:hypothetical protein